MSDDDGTEDYTDELPETSTEIVNKLQFMVSFFKATKIKEQESKLEACLVLIKTICKQFLTHRNRLLLLASQTILFSEKFDVDEFISDIDSVLLKERDDDTSVALSDLRTSVLTTNGVTTAILNKAMIWLTKRIELPKSSLPTLLRRLVDGGVLASKDALQILASYRADTFNAEQFWRAINSHMISTENGMVISKRRANRPYRNIKLTEAGYFLLWDAPKKQQFSSMSFTTSLANAMACGPELNPIKSLDPSDHAAVKFVENQSPEKATLIEIKAVDFEIRQKPSPNATLQTRDDSASFKTITSKTSSFEELDISAKKAIAHTLKLQPSDKSTRLDNLLQTAQTLGIEMALPLDILPSVFQQLIDRRVASEAQVKDASAQLQSKVGPHGVPLSTVKQVFQQVFGIS